MKKIITFLFFMTLSIGFCTLTTSAKEKAVTQIDLLDDGSYIETTMVEASPSVALHSATSTKTGRKTSSYKTSSGTLIWSITINGTFTYNGSTAKCTKATISTSCPNSSWRLSNKIAKKSNNTASASATSKKYVNGICIKTINRTVTLSCSKTGTLS